MKVSITRERNPAGKKIWIARNGLGQTLAATTGTRHQLMRDLDAAGIQTRQTKEPKK